MVKATSSGSTSPWMTRTMAAASAGRAGLHSTFVRSSLIGRKASCRRLAAALALRQQPSHLRMQTQVVHVFQPLDFSFAAFQGQRSAPEDLDIQPQAPMIHVPDVKPEALAEDKVASAVDLGPAREPRPHLV